MGSAQSGTPDTSHTSGPMRPFPRNHVGRPVGAIALPLNISPATHPSRQPPKPLDRLRSPRTGHETTCQEAPYADPHKTTCEYTLTEDTGRRFATFR
jgi:hypothetical protein